MALVGGLIGGAGGNIGSASVALLLNTSQFDAGLAKAHASLSGTAAKMQAVGSKMSAVGGALTRGLSVPLAIAGGVATKMALDFNQAFVRIQTLGGKTGQSMESLKSQVLDLAEATGQDPGGLANALYVVTSAGKDAAQNAMPILAQAAKGAALGMGDVNEVAKVLTATTNAYGSETISAAQSMDILSQAVTDSSAEADELAAALGPVIGVAAQVGVSFEQVAAALATATVQGVPTERAATGLRFLLQRLGAETPEATTALKDYGISLGELDRMLAQDGLQGTLQQVAEAFDLNTVAGRQAWDQVVGGARGASVANTMVGQHAADAAAEVENLGNVAGVTQKKFELWGQTITGKNAKALGSLKAAAIRLGTDLIPIFQRIVGVVSKIVDAFNNLSPAAQDAVVKFGLIAGAAGPLLRIFGPLVGLVARLGTALGGIGGAGAAGGGATAGGAGAAAAGVSGLAAALTSIGIPLAAAVGWFALFKHGIAENNEKVGENIQLIHEQDGAIAQLTRTAQERARGGALTADAIAARDALEQYRDGIEGAVNAQISADSATHDWAIEVAYANGLTKEGTSRLAEQIGVLERFGGTLNDTEKFQIANALEQGNFGVAIGVVRDKLHELRGELDKTNTSLKESTGHGRGAAKSADAMGRAYHGASKKQKEFLKDGKVLNDALKESNREFGHGERAVKGMGDAAGKAGGDVRKFGDDAKQAKGPVDDLKFAADKFGHGHYEAKLKADGSQAKAEIGAAIGLAQNFATTWTARLVADRSATTAAGGHVKGGQHGLESDVSRPTLFMAGEAGIREHVSIRPSGGGSKRADGGVVNVYIQTAMGSDVGTIVEKALTERVLKRGALV